MTGDWLRTGVSRRAALTVGTATAALAACGPVAEVARVRSRDWAALADAVEGRLVRPGDARYDRVRRTENPAYDGARPLAVLQARSPRDLATGIAFARDHDLEVAVRSGGHSYPGWSAGEGRLVLDVRPLSRIRLAPEGDEVRATIGAGATLGQVYDALAAEGRGLAAGSCATVGIAGLTLGGGQGIVSRAHGLTCDAVRSLQVVTAAGEVLTVDAEREPDLFWALRGGGGGHLGVVTSFTFATFRAPRVSTAFLQWPLEAAADVLPAWQSWAPAADPRLWSTLRALGGNRHQGGPVVSLSATWTGPDRGLRRRLARLLDDVPPPRVDRRLRRSFLAVTRAYAGCSDVPADECRTGPGGALERTPFAATSHVAYDALSRRGVRDLVERVGAAHDSGLTEVGVSLDSLGGRVGDLAPEDTAFVHRNAIATAQYTATYSGRRRTRALAFVRGTRDALTPEWGDHAYVNYADAALADPLRAYFGDNATRLGAVRRRYDPEGFFTQAQGY